MKATLLNGCKIAFMYQNPEFISQYAASGRFTQGRPRNFTIANSNLVLFLRTVSETSAQLGLFAFSTSSQSEELLIDPSNLNIAIENDLPAAEKSRRERLREGGAGITAYSVDEAGENLCFALNGILFAYKINEKELIEIASNDLVVDPKISPKGDAIAVVSNGVSVYSLASSSWKTLVKPENSNITYGLANFIAAEEFSRISGYWWSPDSKKILIEKVDSSQVTEVHLSDPTDPTNQPRVHRYPFAGEANPTSSLLLAAVDGELIDLDFLTADNEYLVNAGFKNANEIQINLLNRAQNHLTLKIYSIAEKNETIFFEQVEDPWVEVCQPLPKFFDEEFVYLAGEENQKIHLTSGEIPDQNFEVRSVLDVSPDSILTMVSTTPECLALVELEKSGKQTWLTPPDQYCTGTKKHGITLISEHSLTNWQASYKIINNGYSYEVKNLAPQPSFAPNVKIIHLTKNDLYVSVILPNNYQGEKLPVILSPYGGPHAQRVLKTASGYFAEQFLAQQGYVVLVIDGRGTAGRGKDFSQSISEHWAEKVLADQINGLNETAELFKETFDLTRVGIMGWSYGGYLAAYAALTRSDLFKAAIAGAPVTDWRWYDTAYSERYLGLPKDNLNAYQENSLVNKVDSLSSALLLIHGLADDNVLAMHSLQLSSALFAKGKSHNFLSLSGVSHMTPQTTITENLLKLEIDFFNKNLKS
jgi:dipeptidyl-peptidase-4